jgi:hypothetical protein
MAKRGRPRSSKARTPGGQLSRVGQCLVRDYGNIKVVQRHNVFRHFIDDKGLVFEGSSAGRLWIVGGFDGYDTDPQVLRDVLLEYGRAYWGEYPTASASPTTPRRTAGDIPAGSLTTPTHAGSAFNKLDQILRGAGRQSREAVHNVAVDPHFFPDEDKAWIARIINSRVVQKRCALRAMNQADPRRSLRCGRTACDSDWAMLHCVSSARWLWRMERNRAERRSAA